VRHAAPGNLLVDIAKSVAKDFLLHPGLHKVPLGAQTLWPNEMAIRLRAARVRPDGLVGCHARVLASAASPGAPDSGTPLSAYPLRLPIPSQIVPTRTDEGVPTRKHSSVQVSSESPENGSLRPDAKVEQPACGNSGGADSDRR
jgi:hypothetical protein